MRKIFLILALFVGVSFIESCKKDGSGEPVNTIKITEGEFSGYSHTFTPNLGFWSPTNETTRYVHLVLGDNDNQTITGENIMSILFYDTGAQIVEFPSPDTQGIQFGINFNGTVYYFKESFAEMTIAQSDDFHFEGNLSGQFIDISDDSRKISFEMHISIPLQGI